MIEHDAALTRCIDRRDVLCAHRNPQQRHAERGLITRCRASSPRPGSLGQVVATGVQVKRTGGGGVFWGCEEDGSLGVCAPRWVGGVAWRVGGCRASGACLLGCVTTSQARLTQTTTTVMKGDLGRWRLETS